MIRSTSNGRERRGAVFLLLGSTVLVIAALKVGTDTPPTSPFHAPREISCAERLTNFRNALKAVDTPDTVEKLRAELLNSYKNCIPPPPQAKARVVVIQGGPGVLFDASGSTGEGLQYQWLTNDMNHPDAVLDRRVVFRYSVPGRYRPELIVTDAFERSSRTQANDIEVVHGWAVSQ
jgi:hypothetical protein